MDTPVQADGNISIPKELRDALGLKPGTVMDLQQQAGALVARMKTVRTCSRNGAGADSTRLLPTPTNICG